MCLAINTFEVGSMLSNLKRLSLFPVEKKESSVYEIIIIGCAELRVCCYPSNNSLALMLRATNASLIIEGCSLIYDCSNDKMLKH